MRINIKAKMKKEDCADRTSTFINTYHISSELFDNTIKILRVRGRKRQEGLVLWAGTVDEEWTRADILNVIVPRKGHWGGGVTLNHKALVKISDYLNEKKYILLAQVHTHPSDFGHSPGDEITPTCHRYGFVSIVVPNYALDDHPDLDKCYVYEYLGKWKWRLLQKDKVSEQFSIEKSVIRI